MNKAEFLKLLRHPEMLQEGMEQGLSELVSRYPYFQAARSLFLKTLYNRNSLRYNLELKTTALYMADREILFEWITSDLFLNNEVADKIRQNQNKEKIEVVENSENYKDTSSRDDSKEETLPVSSPLKFSKEDRYSFEEWLKYTSTITLQAKPVKKSKEQLERFRRIDEFLEKGVRISASRDTDAGINLAEEVNEIKDHLMTETLARVYIEQKRYVEAIEAYKILSLKYPEKSGFFGDRIRELRNLIKEAD